MRRRKTIPLIPPLDVVNRAIKGSDGAGDCPTNLVHSILTQLTGKPVRVIGRTNGYGTWRRKNDAKGD